MSATSATLSRISDARLWLTAKVPFLGVCTLRLRPRLAREGDGVETAAVAPDGTLVLNEEFCAQLTDGQFRGLLAHEVLHPALDFFGRLGDRDLSGFNVAHDYVINAIIVDFAKDWGDSLELPPGGLLNRKYDDNSAEEVYALLPRRRRGQPGNPGGGQGPGKPGRGKPGKGQPGQGKGQPGGGLGGDCRPDLASTKQGKAAAQGDASAKESLGRVWKTTLIAAAQEQTASKNRGDLPGALQRIIDEILDPKIPWAEVLADYLGEHAGKPDLTYMRPSRRSGAVGEILVGRRRRSFPDVTILWDTSGSMNGEAKHIFPEVASMCEDLSLTLRVIIIDAAIHSDLEDVTEAQTVAESLSGGGGSNFMPAFDRLDEERNTSVVVAFTDGYIGVPVEMPTSLQGVVWVVTSRGVDPTQGRYGTVLKLDEEYNGSWE
jgi:predicted metal-dependent peptidase